MSLLLFRLVKTADILFFLPQLLRMQHLAAAQKLINKQLIASAPLILQCFAAKLRRPALQVLPKIHIISQKFSVNLTVGRIFHRCKLQ